MAVSGVLSERMMQAPNPFYLPEPLPPADHFLASKPAQRGSQQQQQQQGGWRKKNNRKRKQQTGSEPAPSLAALRHRNSQQTKRHFPGNRRGAATPAATPQTVPRAPFNDTTFLIREANGFAGTTPRAVSAPGATDTPASLCALSTDPWASGPGEDEEQVPKLDFFGTNDGLIKRLNDASDASDDDSSSSGSESEPDAVHGWRLEVERAGAGGAAPALLPSSQSAYIMQLEQANLQLEQRNAHLDELRRNAEEHVFLKDQEAAELREESAELRRRLAVLESLLVERQAAGQAAMDVGAAATAVLAAASEVAVEDTFTSMDVGVADDHCGAQPPSR